MVYPIPTPFPRPACPPARPPLLSSAFSPPTKNRPAPAEFGWSKGGSQLKLPGQCCSLWSHYANLHPHISAIDAASMQQCCANAMSVTGLRPQRNLVICFLLFYYYLLIYLPVIFFSRKSIQLEKPISKYGNLVHGDSNSLEFLFLKSSKKSLCFL